VKKNTVEVSPYPVKVSPYPVEIGSHLSESISLSSDPCDGAYVLLCHMTLYHHLPDGVQQVPEPTGVLSNDPTRGIQPEPPYFVGFPNLKDGQSSGLREPGNSPGYFL
jgi:hypothetical protein